MLALSPSPVFPTFGWPIEDPAIGHDQMHFSREIDTNNNNTIFSHNLHQFSQPPEILLEFDHSASFTDYSGDPNMVKKLNHNASERHRRKRMNCLYSSLRSLLPATEQMKKLSIPETVSRVLKYIPELQQQVERLVQRKEELLSNISKQQNYNNNQKIIKQRKDSNSSSVVSATQLTNTEVLVQISTCNNIPLSEILLHLKQEGLVLINSSSFESFGGRLFYNLHLQVEGTHRLECEALSDKLVSLYEKREGLFP